MGDAGGREQLRGEELVVCRKERVRAVQQPDAARLQLGNVLESGLDAVERRDDVEAKQRDVLPPEELHRFPRPEHARVHSEPAPGVRELEVRPRRAPEQGDDHASRLSRHSLRGIRGRPDLPTVCP